MMQVPGRWAGFLRVLSLSAGVVFAAGLACGQQAAPKGEEKTGARKAEAAEKEQLPAQIELLETRYRFEANGDSRKEVHARVHINSELGVRQFARLNFDFNRSFQSVEIPLARVTHANGGTSDALASAITDNPNPAVVKAPAYQDVRVKSVRIFGLEPGDSLEYRVITTTTHPPLAPDFWLDHSFDRSGVVTQEVFELDIPASRLSDSVAARHVELRANAATPAEVKQETAADGSARSIHRWQVSLPKTDKDSGAVTQSPDIELGSFLAWGVLSQQLADLFQSSGKQDAAVAQKAAALTKDATTPREKAEALYDFVSKEIATIDLPLDATGYRARQASDTLSSGYATPEDKYVLLAALAAALAGARPEAELAGNMEGIETQEPRPSLFARILTNWGAFGWCDPGLEVAPFGLLAPDLRGKNAFRVFHPSPSSPLADVAYPLWVPIPKELPFAAFQKVEVDASIGSDGKLTANVRYVLRGDNELLLRVAFHQTPKEKWKDLGQLLSLSDGFRGQVSGVNASDPYATKEPFAVDYEIIQPKLVDWSKGSTVRMPALLPQLGLPDPPAKPAPGKAVTPIELGTPLEVETKMTLRLPAGTTVTAPTGTSVQRDYATFASQYSAKGGTVTASRHIRFLLRQVPGERAADYNAFLRAVLNDQAQDFTLNRTVPPDSSAKPAASPAPTAPKP
jgi:hypothetical protein